MPSLRGLLQEFAKSSAHAGIFPLLEALVEAAEPEDTPTIGQYNDARDARLRFLQDELAEARSGWARVTTDCHELKIKLEKSHSELAEAKAEIERLTFAYTGVSARIDTLRPLAELGRLVRGMQDDSSLRYVASRYHTFTYVGLGWGHIISVDDPAEALRSIQKEEVGDGEA